MDRINKIYEGEKIMKNLKKGFIILFLAMIAFSNLPATEVSAATNKVTATKSTKKKKIPSVKKGTNIVSVKASSSWKDSKAVKFTAPKTGWYTFTLDDLKSNEEDMEAYFAFFNSPKRKKVMTIYSFSSSKKEKVEFGEYRRGEEGQIAFQLFKGETVYLGANKTKAISYERIRHVEKIEDAPVRANGKRGPTRQKVWTEENEKVEEKSFDYSYKLKIKFSKKEPKW